jgi:hypothetical protein
MVVSLRLKNMTSISLHPEELIATLSGKVGTTYLLFPAPRTSKRNVRQRHTEGRWDAVE